MWWKLKAPLGTSSLQTTQVPWLLLFFFFTLPLSICPSFSIKRTLHENASELRVNLTAQTAADLFHPVKQNSFQRDSFWNLSGLWVHQMPDRTSAGPVINNIWIYITAVIGIVIGMLLHVFQKKPKRGLLNKLVIILWERPRYLSSAPTGLCIWEQPNVQVGLSGLVLTDSTVTIVARHHSMSQSVSRSPA